MNHPRFWIALGAAVSAVGILFIILAFEAERRSILCSTTVPHVACPMADFATSFLFAGVLICAGLVSMILGVSTVRP